MNKTIYVLLVILLFIVGYALSWATTVGLVYLVCLCFALKFSLLKATGIWLVLCLLWWFFGKKGGAE